MAKRFFRTAQCPDCQGAGYVAWRNAGKTGCDTCQGSGLVTRKAPKKPKAPDHRRQVVMTEVIRPDGKRDLQAMSSREAASQLGRSKGGQTKAARGRTKGNFTPETARKAARRLWTGRWKISKRIGVRVGRPAKMRPALNHAALRAYYEMRLTKGVQHYTCPNGETSWLKSYSDGSERQISERTALIHLGYLKPKRKHRMPEVITKVVSGKKYAGW